MPPHGLKVLDPWAPTGTGCVPSPQRVLPCRRPAGHPGVRVLRGDHGEVLGAVGGAAVGIHRQRGAHVSLSAAAVLNPALVWIRDTECPPRAGDGPGLSPRWGPVPATCPGAQGRSACLGRTEGCLTPRPCPYTTAVSPSKGHFCGSGGSAQMLPWGWSPHPASVKAAQSCPTLCSPTDCSPPGSSVHAIPQPRILEWVARPFSRGSSPPRDQTRLSCVAGGFFTTSATWETL